MVGIHADEEAALTAGGNTHVAADQESQATEHLLLGVSLATEQRANAISEIHVVRHDMNLVGQTGVMAEEKSAEDETKRRFEEALERKRGRGGAGGNPHDPGRTVVPQSNTKRQRTFRRKSGGG